MNNRNLVWGLFGTAVGALALRAWGQSRAAPLPARDAPDGSNSLGGAPTGAVAERESVPQATIGETLGVIGEVVLPTLAKGVIIRRPKVMALAEWLDLDRRAVRRMQKLRNKYGRGPLLLRIPIRRQALILAPEHVHRVLAHSPEPFATASFEKRGALSHFEPKMVLVSHGPERAERRRFNEEVLDTQSRVHRLAAAG